MPPIDPRLWDAYQATVYEVHSPEGVIPIRIGRLHPLIDRLCVLHGARTWCFITARNPGSRQIPAADNQHRNAALRAKLERDGFFLLEGVGRGEDPEWEPEASFLVLDLEREPAQQLGRRWGQNALVFGERGGVAELVWLVGSDGEIA